MISLDMQTLLFSHVVTDLVCLVIIALLWRQSQRQYTGMVFWMADFALQTIAAILVSLRGSIPDWTSILLSDSLVIGGAILGYVGLTQFAGKKVTQVHNIILLAVFACIHAYFSLVQPNLAARILNVSAGMLLVFLQCVWFSVRGVEPGLRRVMRGVGLVFSAYSLISFVRIVGIFSGTGAVHDLFQSSLFEILILGVYQVLFILLTFSLVLMVNTRLLGDVGAGEEKFAKAFHSSPYAITLTRLSDGQIVDVNDGFLNILGYQESEILGKTTLDLRLWENEDDRKSVVEELSKNGRLQGGEFQFRKKSGENITGLISAEVISVNGQTLVLSSVSDITARKQAEVDLKAALKKLKAMEAIVNHGPVMLFLWRVVPGEWPVELVSENVNAVLGYTAENFLSGRISWPGITHPEDASRLEAEVMGHLEQGRHEWSQEYRLLTRSGEIRWVRDWNHAITNAGGEITHIQALAVDITERKQVEEALEQSRLDMARAQEVGQVGSWRLDVHRDVLTWSDENHRIFGVPRGTPLTYETFLGTIHPDDRQYVDAQWNAGLAGQPYDIEHRIVADGRIKWVREKAFLEFDEAGGLLGGFGITQDITERKQVEHSLRESEERYRSTLDNMMEGCQIIGFDWRYLYVNDVAASHGRQAKEQLIGRTMLDVYPGIEHTKMFDALRECMQVRLPYRLENEFLYPDGTKSWFDLRMNPVAEGVFILSIDITERKLAEEALVRERGLLRTLVDNLPEEIYVKDRDHRFLLVNQVVVNALGAASMEEVIGRRDEDFFPAGEAQRYTAEEDDIMTHGRSIIDDIHTRLHPSDGQQWYLRTKIPLSDSAGRIIGLIGTGRNITERIQAEQALAAAHAEIVNERNRLQALMEALPVGVSFLDSGGGDVLSNKYFEQIWGGSRPFVHGVDDYAAYRAWWADSGQPLQPEEWASAQAVRTGRAATGQLLKIQRFDGSLAYVLNSASPIFGQQDQVAGCAVAILDVTELKRREDEIRQLNHTLKALSDSNQMMSRAMSEQDYLNEICRLIVEDCGHAMVWIGYAEDDEQKTVRPVASAGFERGYLETLNITWGDGERGRGPTGTAIRTGQASLCNNMFTDPNFAPWREQALKRGYASSLVLPLIAGDRVFGVINIYAREPEAFSVEEKKLLEELASDLSYGITATRLRAAHAQAEMALRQSEERYRSLFNSMTEGFALHEIICDENGLPYDYRFIEINPSFEELTGLRRAMVVGRTVREVIPGIEQSWIDTYGQVALTGQPAHFDNYSAVLDRHYEVHAHCPAPFQFAVLFVDVTARKRAEAALHQLNVELEQRVVMQTAEIVKANVDLEQRIAARTSELQTANHDLQTARLAALNLMEDALDAKKELEKVNAMLRESEERFRLALKNAPVTVATQDRDLRFTWAYNQRTVRPADVIGKTDADLFPSETAARLVALKHQVLETGAEVKEQMWVGSGGQQVYLDVYLEPIRDSGGDITGVGIATVDLTDRKRAEKALQAAHDQLELRVQERTQELVKEIAERREVERQLRIQTTAMEAAANGIVITDHQGTIEWTNPALTRISSYDARDLIGRNMSVFSSGQHDKEYYRHLWDTILAGQVWRGEMINRRKDGSLYVEEQTITPVFDENEQIPHFISIKQDITERKQAEEELERRNLELQFISAAEHEQRQLAEALVKAALVLNKSLRLEEIFALILDEVRGVIPYQLADIILLDGDTFYNASRRSDPDWPDPQAGLNSSFQLDDFPMLKEMRQSGQPVLVADTQQMADWVGVDGLASCRSFLSAPLLVEKKVIGFVNLFSNKPEFFTRSMSDRLVAFAAHAAVAIQNAWLFEQVRAGSERLQSLSRRLVEVQENERLYIARELHDEAGQSLTSLLVQLQLLENQAAAQKDVSQIATEMENSINEVLENLHRVAMALRPASLDHVGLVAALRQHVESMGEKYGLAVSFRSVSFHKRLPHNVETNLYRIVQEALTNVVRHAHATQVDVVLTVRDDKLIVIVEDNGIGFDPHAVQGDKHLGLFGMRERVDTIGGKIVIESEPGKGTTIMVEVEHGASNFDR